MSKPTSLSQGWIPTVKLQAKAFSFWNLIRWMRFSWTWLWRQRIYMWSLSPKNEFVFSTLGCCVEMSSHLGTLIRKETDLCCCRHFFFYKMIVAWASLLLLTISSISLTTISIVGHVMYLQTQLGPLGLLAASWKKWAQRRAMKQGGQGGRRVIYWSRGVVCARWQLIPHAGGRLSRQADQKVKAPGGPPFEMGMGPRYQTENMSKLPATEQLHIHGWDWQ